MPLNKYDLDHNVGYLVIDISRLVTTEYNRRLFPLGLTRAQFRVVFYLHRQDGQTQSELASLLQTGKVSTGGLVDRLEHSGWVERHADPKDKRSNRVYLTKKGKAIEKSLLDTGRELTMSTMKGLSREERGQLVDLLIAVKNNLLELEAQASEEESEE